MRFLFYKFVRQVQSIFTPIRGIKLLNKYNLIIIERMGLMNVCKQK